MVFTSGKKSYFYPKTLDKKLCDLNYAKCAHWNFFFKNVKKNEYIERRQS